MVLEQFHDHIHHIMNCSSSPFITSFAGAWKVAAMATSTNGFKAQRHSLPRRWKRIGYSPLVISKNAMKNGPFTDSYDSLPLKAGDLTCSHVKLPEANSVTFAAVKKKEYPNIWWTKQSEIIVIVVPHQKQTKTGAWNLLETLAKNSMPWHQLGCEGLVDGPCRRFKLRIS